MTQESRDTDRNDNRPSSTSRWPWRAPSGFGEAVLAGVTAGLILLAGGNVVKNIDIDVGDCAIVTTVYSATFTAALPSAC
ncbi:hypothetical protein [Nocardia goodfellowii]|uniref:Uncharacterized protein n=1 Tax=Nocardia goodfellowii TaxID=882446 RepID=A0ABS4QGB2_9NOCA|nr:hypothetical protein [Nocardia goodfellowii]MBP2190190.1 hypothetical protein [Nocardia goodfellowii]